ncbi:MAG: DUF1543 domain-containing protein [Coxiellaceae bacterium]|nr:MAG: DUF1543 domain-containing protein [Coxiellaceae bacterium]
MKLFAVLLGGRAKGCNIELHDVVFVAGNSLEETYPHLINLWFGMTKRLHIDASIELSNVDGYRIVLSQQETPAGQNKFLFFVNFGAYRANYFGEVHEMNFYVAESKSQALVKAKKNYVLICRKGIVMIVCN